MKMTQKSSMWLRAILCGGLICAGIIFFSAANQPGGVMRYQREVGSSSYFFYLEIVNRTFSNSLLDPTSDYYRSLKAEVEALINNVYNCSSCSTKDAYDGVYDMSFSNGSLVVAKMTLIFHTTTINPIVVKFLFINSIIANPPSDLQVDLQFTRDVQTPVIATTTTATPTSPMATRTPLVNNNTTTVSPATNPSPSLVSSISFSTTSNNSITASSGLPSLHNTTQNSTTPQRQNQHGTTTGSRPHWFDWVPGWGIALLVLTALILLLLIILFILVLVRLFCKKKEKSQLPVSPPYWPSAPSPAPTYVSHSPAPVLKDMSDDHPDGPKRNKTGLYVVNP